MAKFVTNPLPDQINWEDESSYLVFNPNWPPQMIRRLENLPQHIEKYPSRLWLMTSGSQGFPKCIGLKKQGLMASAESLAHRYGFKANEIWLNGLPPFHVGGLSIWARAFKSNQKVSKFGEWSPKDFHEACSKERAQWTSLVPTQIYDLVQLDLPAPQSLRGVFVGGGALRSDLYWAARELKWPLLPTYGMTEASSQIATAQPDSLKYKGEPRLDVLDHVKVKIDPSGRVGVSGPSVTDLIGICHGEEWKFSDPRDSDGWYWTQDSGELKENHFKLLGRADDLKKIRGELVSLNQLQGRLDQVLLELRYNLGPIIHFLPDPRTGYRVVLVMEPADWPRAEDIKARLKNRCAPYEQVEQIYVVQSIPKTDLGKIKREELEKLLR